MLPSGKTVGTKGRLYPSGYFLFMASCPPIIHLLEIILLDILSMFIQIRQEAFKLSS